MDSLIARNQSIPQRYRIHARDNYGMGAAAAVCSGRLIRASLGLLSRWARGNPGRLEQVVRESRSRARFIQKNVPGRMSELRGLADGLSMHPDDLITARVIMESLAVRGCTNFGAVPPATAGDDVMVSWNFDVPPYLKLLMGRFPLFVRDLEGKAPYVCLGVPALFGIGILNAEGLCCVVNAVGFTDNGDGFTPFELNNMAMESCSTVDEASQVFERGPRGAINALTAGILMNWNMIWADKSGGLSVIEYSHNHFNQQRAGEDGIMASTNHHQFLDRSLTGSVDPVSQGLITGSYSRLARMYSLLRQNHGSIDPLVARRTVSDHIPDYSLLEGFGILRRWWQRMPDDCTICAHPWNLGHHLRRGDILGAFVEINVSTTVYSLQIQPKSSTVWLTNGQPCRTPTTPYDFSGLLGSTAKALVEPVLEPPAPRVERKKRSMFSQDSPPLQAFLTRSWNRVLAWLEKLDIG